MSSGPPTVGLVSPGAMGSALARALADGGSRVVATLAGRSLRSERLADAAGIERLPGLDAVVDEADVVLSVAPPDQAEAIARSVAAAAERTGSRPLVADLNAIAPMTARRIEAELRTVGVDLVDGSISGPPPRPGAVTRIYLSGERAGEVAALAMSGVDVRIVGADIGTASAIKMCTASVYKGTAALITHALVTARQHGVVEDVLDDLGGSLPELADGAARTITRAASKADRYVGEMREIAATQASAGLPSTLFEAMAEVYAALSTSPLAHANPEDIDPERELRDVLGDLAPTTS